MTATTARASRSTARSPTIMVSNRMHRHEWRLHPTAGPTRLADIQTEIDAARNALRPLNDDTLRPRVESLLTVAAELVAVHGAEPRGDIAEALAGLQSATRALRVP